MIAAVSSLGEWAQLITAVALLAGVVFNVKVSKAGNEKVDEVHAVVNSTAATAVKRIEQLSTTLAEADVKLPKSPNGI